MDTRYLILSEAHQLEIERYGLLLRATKHIADSMIDTLTETVNTDYIEHSPLNDLLQDAGMDMHEDVINMLAKLLAYLDGVKALVVAYGRKTGSPFKVSVTNPSIVNALTELYPDIDVSDMSITSHEDLQAGYHILRQSMIKLTEQGNGWTCAMLINDLLKTIDIKLYYKDMVKVLADMADEDVQDTSKPSASNTVVNNSR